jgi:predicted unusual protein kinase regulating ubiquinone biosynthesis (AarF/ABC1/UbiB family)
MEWIEGVPLAELALLGSDKERADRTAALVSKANNLAKGEAAAQETSTHPASPPSLSSSAHSLDPGPIIEVGVQCALDQLLEHGFFHGDPVSE